MGRRRVLCAVAAACAAAATGCGTGGDDTSTRGLPIDAFCQATVVGVGLVDVEDDYLPNVINCENGGADFEALKAQAVSARSYLYYRLERTGEIQDGTSDQVYTCGRDPGPEHYMAVAETSGQVLQYQGTQVAAFYVAGSLQDGPTCTGGADDPTNTERYVTYNMGLSGDDIVQTTLGFVDPSNHANRGCKSQNGAHCLAEEGWLHADILRFYYGEDIEVVTAEGPCIVPGEQPDAGPGAPDAGSGADGGEVSGGCSSTADGRAWLLSFGLALLAWAVSRTARRRRRTRRR